MKTKLEEAFRNTTKILPKFAIVPKTHRDGFRISKKLLEDLCHVVCGLEEPVCILQEVNEACVKCYFLNEKSRDNSIAEIKKHCLREYNRTIVLN